ncbi:MAG: formylmethanofuran dehydrogenase subunit B [Planctomycetales bacterium]
MIEPAPITSVEDVVCTACGCVCDDLRLTVRSNRILQLEPPCPLAERWLKSFGTEDKPIAEVNGQPADYGVAVEQAARYLKESVSPLIYGLSLSSTPGQRVAVALADQLGGTIDTTASQCHAPSIMALQQVGESTCSLGEAKYRADLVIYWGVDPATTHPRHLERYSDSPQDNQAHRMTRREIVVVDTERTATADNVDTFIPLQPDRHFEALWTLRSLIRGVEPPGEERNWGADPELLRHLAARMRQATCGIFYFGLGLTAGALGARNVEALLLLTRDLNDLTRFHARRMRIYGDVAGADSVLCWQTGYPFSVNLAPGYPRYNPGEFSANDMLERGEVDCCLLVGDECRTTLSPRAREVLERIPTIVLQGGDAEINHPARVRFRTAIYGIHAAGTAYRMDEIPLPLKPILTSRYPTDETVLAEIRKRLQG